MTFKFTLKKKYIWLASIIIILFFFVIYFFILNDNYGPNFYKENEPFFLQGNDTLCILIHGFASGPQEMKYLGHYLNSKGFTINNILLAGHGSNPSELRKTRWLDWENQIRAEIKITENQYKRIFLIGFSMGGLLALRASVEGEITGIIAISPSLYIYKKGIHEFPVTFLMKSLSHIIPYIRLNRNRTFYYKGQKYDRYIYNKLPLASIYQLFILLKETKDQLSSFDKPLLLLHAFDDKTSDFTSSKDIYHLVSSQTKILKEYSAGGHLIVLNDTRDCVFEEIYEFIR